NMIVKDNHISLRIIVGVCKGSMAILSDIRFGKVGIDRRLDPGVGFLRTFHDFRIPDLAVWVHGNRYPDGTMDGKLRQKRDDRNNRSAFIPADVETVKRIVGIPTRPLFY